MSTPETPGWEAAADERATHSSTAHGVGQGREKLQQAASQARDQAQEVAGQAQSRIKEQVDNRTTEAGQRATSLAQDLRAVAEELRRREKDTPAALAEQAAQKVERAGTYLRDSDPDRILEDIESFARRQPWAVVAGGIALGFVASRVLKASSGQRHRSRQLTEPVLPPVEPPVRSDVAATYGTMPAREEVFPETLSPSEQTGSVTSDLGAEDRWQGVAAAPEDLAAPRGEDRPGRSSPQPGSEPSL